MKEIYKKLEQDFAKLPNDVAKWKFIIENKEHFLLKLDNDVTHVTLKEDDDHEYHFNLNEFLGWDDGVFYLLQALDIEAESV